MRSVTGLREGPQAVLPDQSQPQNTSVGPPWMLGTTAMVPPTQSQGLRHLNTAGNPNLSINKQHLQTNVKMVCVSALTLLPASKAQGSGPEQAVNMLAP